ncbi:MAG: TonB-dependent receptor [Acidobacteriaceae bacterium]|nr:TonB-dependent receptor [Acidobacteriaceae bacterium]
MLRPRLLLTTLLVPLLARAQNTSCALSGSVQDPSGAPVPLVSVKLTDEANKFVRTTATTNDGYFSFPDLTPATFTLTIEMQGFKTYEQKGIGIDAGETRSLQTITLQVGQVSESVTVNAAPVAVNLATGERSGTLTGDQLDHIALRGRDIFDAVSLMPGVVDTTDGRDAPSPTSIGGIYIMGGRNDSKNMTLDGVTNLDTGSNGSVHNMPSMDSVAEVKVLMSAYSAENGRNPSSINVITKGGTSEFHGQAAWYFRNEDLNANNFFNNEAGQPRTEYRYNIASYSIGGPVILPKIHRSRNGLFFFFNQEFQEQVTQYGTKEVTVPTALERQGNFSHSYNSNGTLIKVNDPLNGKKQFPGNVIPASRLTPIGEAILNMFPLPNFKDPNPAYTYNWNYFASEAGPAPRRTESARIDYSPRQNWQVYLTLGNNADRKQPPYGIWVDGKLNFPLTPIIFQQPGRVATLHSINTISPSMFNEASVAVSQNTLTFVPKNLDAVNRTKLGITIPQRNPALNPLDIIPDMSFSGIPNYADPSLDDGTPYYNRNTIYSFVDNVSMVRGTHTMKTGVYYEHTLKIQSASPLTRGSISFNTDGNNALDANNAYANALLGNYDSYAEATARPLGHFLFTNLEFFVQDTWRMKPNLSLDYGMRFYADPPQYEAGNQLASFSIAAYNPATAPVLLRPATINGVKVALNPVTGQTFNSGLIGDFAPGIGNPADGSIIGGKNGVPRGLYTISPLYVAPRFGFAWDPFRTGRTSIRGGGGIYFDRIEGNPVMGQLGNPPTVFTPTQYYGTFSDIAASASAGLLSPTGTLTSLSGKGHEQAVYDFNLSIQRQIGSTNLFDIGYAGSLGRHLLEEQNINPVPLGANFLSVNPQDKDPTTTNSALPANFLRPYQGLGNVMLYEFATSSNYHSLLASFQHRLSSGMNVSLSYTFSKALDEADAYSDAVDPFISPRARNYGPAGFDRRHVFSANFYWTLPKPGTLKGLHSVRWLVDNWELAGVARMSTGGPFTPTYSLINSITSPTGSPSETARAEVINPNAPLAQRFGPPPEPAGLNVVPWSVSSTTPQLGNLGRNTITGPGVNNWDLSLYRTLHFGERVTTYLRFETYNTFNHSQFSKNDEALKFDSQGNQANPAFDQPTTARPPRIIQLAVRLNF